MKGGQCPSACVCPNFWRVLHTSQHRWTAQVDGLVAEGIDWTIHFCWVYSNWYWNTVSKNWATCSWCKNQNNASCAIGQSWSTVFQGMSQTTLVNLNFHLLMEFKSKHHVLFTSLWEVRKPDLTLLCHKFCKVVSIQVKCALEGIGKHCETISDKWHANSLGSKSSSRPKSKWRASWRRAFHSFYMWCPSWRRRQRSKRVERPRLEAEHESSSHQMWVYKLYIIIKYYKHLWLSEGLQRLKLFAADDLNANIIFMAIALWHVTIFRFPNINTFLSVWIWRETTSCLSNEGCHPVILLNRDHLSLTTNGEEGRS